MPTPPLPSGPYSVVYADPPWRFSNDSKGRRVPSLYPLPSYRYDVMDLEDIKALPIKSICEPNAALFLWVCDALLKEGIETMEAWGFTYKTVAFTWAKQAKTNHDKWHFGLGLYTRNNPEMCLLGIKGKPLPRQSKTVRQLVIEPLTRHSEKPARIRDDIVELFGDVSRIELFARTKTEGWGSWGNEI